MRNNDDPTSKRLTQDNAERNNRDMIRYITAILLVIIVAVIGYGLYDRSQTEPVVTPEGTTNTTPASTPSTPATNTTTPETTTP